MSSIDVSEAPQPWVSVLMPTRNRAAFLGAAVRSVLEQRFESLELIVVDDGSTDDSAELLAAIDDPRLRVTRTESVGIGAALNAGLQLARGRYVARNDSDDLWLPDLLATLVPVLERSPELGFAYGRAEHIDADGRPTGAQRGRRLPDPEEPLLSLLWCDYTCSITSVYRGSALRGVGGWDAALGTNEDWDVALRVARCHGVAFVDRTLARARLHDGNTTRVDASDLDDRLALRQRVLDKLFATPLPPEVRALRAAAYRNLYVSGGLQLWRAGQRDLARRQFAKAWVPGERVACAARIATIAATWMLDRRIAGLPARFEPWAARLRGLRLARVAQRS